MMPTYEYRCSPCGHEIEVEQHITDEPYTYGRCSHEGCGKAVDMKRLIPRGVSFELKGSGWAKDNYGAGK